MGKRIMKEKMKKAVVFMVALAVALTFTFIPADSLAAAKPAKVKGVKATSVKTTSMKIRWKKAKRAKGYRLYKYDSKTKKYKKVKTTKKRSYTVKKLKAGKKYSFKVRAYRKSGKKTIWGKSSKAYKKSTKKASASNNGSGGSGTTTPNTVTTTIGDQTVTITEGQTVTIKPLGTSYTVKVSSVKESNGKVTTEGTTSNGLPYYCSTKNGNVVALFVGKGYTVGGDYNVYSTQSDYGARSLYTKSNKSSINIYWTCDGTEPQIGQADKTGSCEYTKYTNTAGKTATLTTQLRGTTTYSSGEKTVFQNNKSLDDPNVFWAKAYNNGNVVYEDYITYNIY